MGQTAYDDVNQAIAALLGAMRGVLGPNLVGAYLYGSLANGGFTPGISDIDILAPTLGEPGADVFEALERMHATFARQHPEWDDRIEVQYLPVEALRTFKTAVSRMAALSPGEPFHWKEAGRDWTANWYDVRENGIVLAGPPAAELIPPIASEEFVDAVREYASEWPGRLARWPALRGSHAYVVLTMCRALYTCTLGLPVSKQDGAAWATEQFPEWKGLIQRAREWRITPAVHRQPLSNSECDETARFAGLVLDQLGGSTDDGRT